MSDTRDALVCRDVPSRRWRRLWRSILAFALLTAPALAQAQEVARAPRGEGWRAPWVSIVLAGFLIVCVVIASIMSSRRGHQD